MSPEKTLEAPDPVATPTHEHTRTGMSKDALNRAFIDNLFYVQGRFREVASPNDRYMAAGARFVAVGVDALLLTAATTALCRIYKPDSSTSGVPGSY